MGWRADWIRGVVHWFVIPCPKKWAQTMFAKLRAKKGSPGMPVGHDGLSEPLYLRSFSPEELEQGFVVDRVIDFAALAVVDYGFSRISRSFATDLTEERSERIIIVLGPLVERWL